MKRIRITEAELTKIMVALTTKAHEERKFANEWGDNKYIQWAKEYEDIKKKIAKADIIEIVSNK